MFDARFKFAAIHRAGDRGGQVKGINFFAVERFRHLAGHDFFGQPFHDGGFAHARLAQNNRVIFGAARKNLDDAADFFFAADDRVHSFLEFRRSQVIAEKLQGACRFVVKIIVKKIPLLFFGGFEKFRQIRQFGGALQSGGYLCRQIHFGNFQDFEKFFHFFVFALEQGRQKVLGADVFMPIQIGDLD